MTSLTAQRDQPRYRRQSLTDSDSQKMLLSDVDGIGHRWPIQDIR
jgi:hypothetical protein